MPVKRHSIAAFLLLASCASGQRVPEPEGADRLDADVAATVRAGRDRGYPDLADVPRPQATSADARALASDAGRLSEEAEVLRALREEARQPRPPSDLSDRAERLRRQIADARADLAAQPPVTRPVP